MATAITSRITRLEFNEEFHSTLIGTRLQTLNHLRPVSDKTLEAKTKSTWFFNEASIFWSPNYNTPSTCIPTP
jgi:hypothetical protein